MISFLSLLTLFNDSNGETKMGSNLQSLVLSRIVTRISTEKAVFFSNLFSLLAIAYGAPVAERLLFYESCYFGEIIFFL